MKKFNEIQLKILQDLCDGRFHNGQVLGEKLGISHTAVWKQIQQLTELGIPIQRMREQGYQLHDPLTLLDEAAIRHYLHHETSTIPSIHLFASLDSTNQYLKSLPPSDTIQLCCTEQQTKGRGRFNRKWYSPFGENIYCSLRWQLACDLSTLSGLSLVVSLAIRRAINVYLLIDDIQVKWPNDLMWQDRKLSGALIEIQAERNGMIYITVGIGLNVNSLTANHSFPDTPWSSLRDITGKNINRNELMAKLFSSLEHYLHHFLAEGLSHFYAEWNKADYLKGQIVTVSNATETFTGIAQGIDKQGQLCVIDQQGVEHFLASGDTSLKRKD